VRRRFKVGGFLSAGVLLLALFTLRLTGLEPADNGANSRPGLWLPGEVVTSAVTDWSFTDKIPHIMVQTRTPFLLPYSVTAHVHVYRLFQRNIPEYGETQDP
jgi:hypothetical protein